MKGVIILLFLLNQQQQLFALTTSTTLSIRELHEEIKNTTINHNKCKDEICSNRNPIGFGLYSPTNLTHAKFINLPCFCDEPKCHEFGDCCIDLVTDTWLQESRDTNTINGISSDLWSCQIFTFITFFGEQENHTIYVMLFFCYCGILLIMFVQRTSQYSWMISSCNSEDADPFLIDNCIGNVENYNYIHDIPKILNSRNQENTLIFRNIYCAMCNGYTIEDFIPINIDIKCTEATISVQEVLNGTYERGKLSWKIEGREYPISCSATVKEYTEISDFNKEYKTDIRQCRHEIKTCPDDWADDEIIKKCNSYSFTIRDANQTNNVYKNPHCGICNGVENAECLLIYGKMGHMSRRPIQPLSVIFHFSIGNGKSNTIGADCTDGYFMDPLYQKCRPIFSCHPKSKFKSIECNLELNCDTISLSPNEYYILPNDSLYINTTGETVGYNKYNFIPTTSEVEVCADAVSEVLTTKSSKSSFSEIQGYLTLICTIISLTGLGLHISVLIALPKLRNLPGRISMSMSITLFLAQALFLWAASELRPENIPLCIALAAILHFLFLSVFAWTSVMSYDIWRTFLPPAGYKLFTNKKTQFIKYVIFATVLPGSIVLCSLLFDTLGPEIVISPGYGDTSICWFGTRAGLGLFFALPVSCILIINIIMYAKVIMRLRQEFQAVSQCLSELNDRETKYTQIDFKVQFSIFNVMGGTWILGILAGFIDRPFIWYLFIILNGSQGAIIFILQIMKPRVWNMIMKKVKGIEDTTTTGTNSSRNNKTNSTSFTDKQQRESLTKRKITTE